MSRAGEGAGADRLIRSLLALDGPLRPVAARLLLESLPPAELAESLEVLLARADAGEGPASEALAPLTAALSALGESESAGEIYAEARRANLLSACRLLMRPAPAQRFDPRAELSVDREMRQLALGTRKQLARIGDPVVLTRLLADPDPTVVRTLLAHPRLTEPEVVRMAARRPVRPEVLAEIWRSPRWGVRTRVRSALCNNPYTPPEAALKIVPLLPLTLAREVAENGTLHEEVRRAAQARLAGARRRRQIARAAAHLAKLEPEGDA